LCYTDITTTGKVKRGDKLISSDILRGYNDTIILSLLAEHDSYGYEISREIENRSNGIYTMKETTLYSAFIRLQKNGYIISYSGAETFGKPRTYYRITESGTLYFREKCEEWELTKELIDRFTQNYLRGTTSNGSD
jgi:DNA-binding PadR family transcriptional regulator